MSVPDFGKPKLDPAPSSCSCLPCWRAVNLKEPKADCFQIGSQRAAIMHVAVTAWRRFGLILLSFLEVKVSLPFSQKTFLPKAQHCTGHL